MYKENKKERINMESNIDLKGARVDINAALAEIGKKYGFTASIGNISFNDAGFHSTIQARVNDVGNGKSGAQLEYEAMSGKFGLAPDSFGKWISSNGDMYQIVGLRPRARKYPVLGRNANGEEVCFMAGATVKAVDKE